MTNRKRKPKTPTRDGVAIITYVTTEQRAALERIRVTDGISIRRQIDRALGLWFKAYEASVRPEERA